MGRGGYVYWLIIGCLYRLLCIANRKGGIDRDNKPWYHQPLETPIEPGDEGQLPPLCNSRGSGL